MYICFTTTVRKENMIGAVQYWPEQFVPIAVNILFFEESTAGESALVIVVIVTHYSIALNIQCLFIPAVFVYVNF